MFSNLPLKWILKFAKRNKILNFKQNKNKTYLVIGSGVEAFGCWLFVRLSLKYSANIQKGNDGVKLVLS